MLEQFQSFRCRNDFVVEETGWRGEKSLMMSVNLLLSEGKSQTNYGPGSSSRITGRGGPAWFTLIAHLQHSSLYFSYFSCCLALADTRTPTALHQGVDFHCANILGKLSCQFWTWWWWLFIDKAERKGWRHVFVDTTGHLVCFLWSVRLSVVQGLAGSKPYNESRVELRGWFDCSPPVCWLQC